jgi:predicted nucleic acid-binding protein
MTRIVADTSALVSLGTVDDSRLLDTVCDTYEVVIPEQVSDELAETASYDDTAGRAAERVRERAASFEIRAVTLDEAFPLDDGENAAVTLANELAASELLCDEFNRLALVHASLVDSRLVTTPTLLSALVRADALSPSTARAWLSAMSDARSWESNSYVRRARSTLEQQSE